MAQLTAWTKEVLNESSNWTKCFDSKDDGLSAAAFHRKCNEKGPTITVVLYKMSIFGGFADIPWKTSKGDNVYVQTAPNCRILHLFLGFKRGLI